MKGDKQLISVTVNKRLLKLAKRLGVNRSQAADIGLKSEISRLLKTFVQDMDQLEHLATGYLVDAKKENEFVALLEERLAQEEYAKQREQEIEAAKITEFIRVRPGLPRGELETEYGHVFPNEVWNKVQQKIPVVAR